MRMTSVLGMGVCGVLAGCAAEGADEAAEAEAGEYLQQGAWTGR